jgi:rRNA maturation protein Nop10
VTSTIKCKREECQEEIRVGQEESARCPACGKKHEGPWPHQLESDDRNNQQAESTTSIGVSPGTTVRITIEVEPAEK